MPSNSQEWYTPAKYVRAARVVMGGKIDLDPASCPMANRVVQATTFYTKEQNGLEQKWSGRVWLNPPYGRVNPERSGQTRSYQLLFAQRLLDEYLIGNVEQAVLLLLGNACFMQWFRYLWDYPLCFHVGHIMFHTPDGLTDDFGFGSIFVYLGPNEELFRDEFSKFDDTLPSPLGLLALLRSRISE